MADNLTLAERWGLLRRGSRDLTIAEQRSAILEAHAELTRLSADVARLSAELEVARRDGERMDYLERELENEQADIVRTGDTCFKSLFRWNIAITRINVDIAIAKRAAIDAAREG